MTRLVDQPVNPSPYRKFGFTIGGNVGHLTGEFLMLEFQDDAGLEQAVIRFQGLLECHILPFFDRVRTLEDCLELIEGWARGEKNPGSIFLADFLDELRVHVFLLAYFGEPGRSRALAIEGRERMVRNQRHPRTIQALDDFMARINLDDPTSPVD